MEMVETMPHNAVHNKLRPWLICLAASLLFFYEFIQGNMFASIADDIMRDFHIQADDMTILSSAYYLANVLFLFVAGLLLDRFSAKQILLVAMSFCIASTLILAQTQSFDVALGCRLIIGAGSAFCFLGPVRIASNWFPAKRMALVTGAIVTVAMSGGLLAQYPLMMLVHRVGWRTALFQVGIAGGVMLGLMLIGIQDRPHKLLTKQKNTLSLWTVTQQAFLNRETVLAGLYASLMNMAVAIFGAVMGQLYLVQRLGASQDVAAIVNGMLFLGAMVGGPLLGWWSDQIGSRLKPMRTGALVSLGLMLAILYAPTTAWTMGVLFFLLGLTTSSQVISYALVAEKCAPAVLASSISLVSILLQGGYIVYQNLFSRMLVNWGEPTIIHGVPIYSYAAYQAATVLLPCSFLLAYLLVNGLKETHGHRQEHA
jgi:MFS family permease